LGCGRDITDFDCQNSLGVGLPTKVERLKASLQTQRLKALLRTNFYKQISKKFFEARAQAREKPMVKS